MSDHSAKDAAPGRAASKRTTVAMTPWPGDLLNELSHRLSMTWGLFQVVHGVEQVNRYALAQPRGYLLDRIADGCGRSMAMRVASLLLDRDPNSIGVHSLLEQMRLYYPRNMAFGATVAPADVAKLVAYDEKRLEKLVGMASKGKFWRDKEGGHIHRRNVDDLAAFDRELKASQLTFAQFEKLLRGMRDILSGYYPVLLPDHDASWNWEATDGFGDLIRELAYGRT